MSCTSGKHYSQANEEHRHLYAWAHVHIHVSLRVIHTTPHTHTHARTCTGCIQKRLHVLELTARSHDLADTQHWQKCSSLPTPCCCTRVPVPWTCRSSQWARSLLRLVTTWWSWTARGRRPRDSTVRTKWCSGLARWAGWMTEAKEVAALLVWMWTCFCINTKACGRCWNAG